MRPPQEGDLCPVCGQGELVETTLYHPALGEWSGVCCHECGWTEDEQ